MTHLHRYLADNGVIYPEQLAEAVHRQQIYGGSLDTVLLELELIDPITMGELLERACGFPIVPPKLLDNGLERPWELIPEDLQRSHWVEPLAVDGDEIIVAVHPDLPNDMLGGLLRNVRRMRPMVTPECCLEKVAAERHRSVVPQRYAVLCASYLSAVKRRPSISGIYDLPHPTATPEPPKPSAPSPTFTLPPASDPSLEKTDPVDRRAASGSIDVIEAAPVDAPTGPPPVARPPRRSTLVASGPPVTPRGTLVATGAPTLPPPPSPHDPAAASIPPAETVEPIATESETSAFAEADTLTYPDGPATAVTMAESTPVDSTETESAPPESTDVVESAPAEDEADPLAPAPADPLVRNEADVLRRLEQARSVLEEARSRDAALEAIISAAMVLSPRAGVFRVRGRELVGLSSPSSELEDLGGKIVDATEDSAASTVLEKGSYLGVASEPDLRLATGANATTPCALQGVEVRGRSVVIVYIDRDGAAIEDADAEHLRELAALAGTVFEEILKIRRASGPTRAAKAPRSSAAKQLGTKPERRWGPASPRVRAAYGDDRDKEGLEPPPIETKSTSRTSTPEREHPEGLPPSSIPPPSSVSEPSDWRLTPELESLALQEPPATLEDEELPRPPVREPATAIPPIRTDLPATHVDDETSFAGVSDTDRDDAEQEPQEEEAAEETKEAAEAEREPPASLEDEELPAPPSAEDVTEVAPHRLASEPPEETERPSAERPTMELSGLGQEPAASPPSESSEPAEEPLLPVNRPTVHSEPPPPPLPPPPPSGFDAEGLRPKRGSTISGLPPPELRAHSTATKRQGPPPGELLPRGDEEVEIISLARPITPATARGRIELEEEDWMPTGAPLASDSLQAKIDDVIDRVVAGETDVDELREHGNAGLLRLLAQFPGPLEVMRRDLRSLPPPSAHGPLIRTIIALGPVVVPHLVDLFEHPNPDVRFYAAFMFHELRDTRCMRPLAKLAFDTNGDVRIISMRVLETYRRNEGFDVAASVVREELGSDARGRQLHAARAAGTLRDIGAIPQLVELLTGGDRFIQEASLESLCSITGQQHGLKPHRWRGWYEEQGQLHRVEWIIDSLRHRDLPVRRWAADELVRITGHRVPFSPMGDRRAREVAAKAWTDWWNARGREIFGAS